MKKKLNKSEKKTRGRVAGLIAGLIILSPMIQLVFFERYYDVEQFFVPDIYNYDVGKYAELSVVTISQQFTSRDRNLSGFDLQLSGEKAQIKWILTDLEGELLREGEVVNAGESRISQIRFEPIEVSIDKKYVFTIVDENIDRGVLMAYSDEEYCTECSLEINEILVDGNLSFVPVYKAENAFKFLRVLSDRVISSVSVSN